MVVPSTVFGMCKNENAVFKLKVREKTAKFLQKSSLSDHRGIRSRHSGVHYEADSRECELRILLRLVQDLAHQSGPLLVVHRRIVKSRKVNHINVAHNDSTLLGA